MKNEKIIAAWDAAQPDAAADARMRGAILERSRLAREAKEKKAAGPAGTTKRILLPIAACLTLMIAAAAIFGVAGGFGGKTYTVNLGTGETVSFKKTRAASTSSIDFSFGFDVTSRDLTAEELQSLSPLLTSGYAAFRADTGELVRFEGEAGETKVIMALPGIVTTDTVIDETPASSTVRGVPVRCGYCLANNGGKPVTLFSAEFHLGNVTVYAERGVPGTDGSAASEEFSQTVLAFIENGEPAFGAVTA